MAKSFRMRQDTEDWFSNISKKKPPINTKFDLYYLCLMIGLAGGRCSEPSNRCPQCTDFVDEFVKDYKPQQNLIVGLLIRVELANKGISLDEKDGTKDLLIKLIDPNSITNLTDYGIERMNAYSSGGFDYLTEKFGSKPYYVEEFLITYVEFLREAVNNNCKWLEISNFSIDNCDN